MIDYFGLNVKAVKLFVNSYFHYRQKHPYSKYNNNTYYTLRSIECSNNSDSCTICTFLRFYSPVKF
jgi:hypothetical protein